MSELTETVLAAAGDAAQASQSLTARQIAYSLFPPLFRSSSPEFREQALKSFLLWPPDLFAFTSTILSVTGAYHLVVSPPNSRFYDIIDHAKREFGHHFGASIEDCSQYLFQWPPRVGLTVCQLERDAEGCLTCRLSQSGETEYNWAKEVRRLAEAWRSRLQNDFYKWQIEQFKHGDDAVRLEVLGKKLGDGVKDGEWLPAPIYQLWDLMQTCFAKEDDLTGSVFDILCNEDDEIYQKRLADLERTHRQTLDQLRETYRTDGASLRKQERLENERYHAERCRYTLAYAEKVIVHWFAFQALMTLHAIADEACVGLGIRPVWLDATGEKGPVYREPHTSENREFFKFATDRLRRFGTMSNIHEHRCRVLPKRHTPGLGITLRSVSSCLSYHRSSVDVKWKVSDERLDNELLRKLRSHQPVDNPQSFSVLLLPWPMQIKAMDFRTERTDCIDVAKKHRLFSYSPDEPGFDQQMLIAALRGARNETRSIDMVVLPECALTYSDIQALESIIGGNEHRVSLYIAGVRTDGPRKTDGSLVDLHDNMVFFKMGNLRRETQTLEYPGVRLTDTDEIQFKHHKWKLERSQIISYNLGHVLSPTVDWWEAIKVRRRKVTFMNVGQELTICPLICEDLARQDPISDLLRTVGPSLVVTILMDGPQRRDRWSSRYASVLAEDPGCAVITLTSFGMVRRWKPAFLSQPVPHVIALWNDGHGSSREIEMDADSLGVLLTLSLDGRAESTSDGRREVYPTNTLTLGGIHQVKARPS